MGLGQRVKGNAQLGWLKALERLSSFWASVSPFVKW